MASVSGQLQVSVPTQETSFAGTGALTCAMSCLLKPAMNPSPQLTSSRGSCFWTKTVKDTIVGFCTLLVLDQKRTLRWVRKKSLGMVG